MTMHAALDAQEHRDLRVRVDASPELGDAVMACLTVPTEFRRVQNEFPILFRRDLERGNFSALALFGFETGENLFLENGRWDARYRPLALSVQPFLIGLPASGDGPAQLHIDLGHARIAPGEDGVRLFDEHGQATPYLESISSKLSELDEGYRSSAGFFAALDQYELLEPFSLDVELADGARHRLVGYHMIDEARLRCLDGAAIAELFTAGHLLPIFMALASLSNLGALVQRKNRAMGLG